MAKISQAPTAADEVCSSKCPNCRRTQVPGGIEGSSVVTSPRTTKTKSRWLVGCCLGRVHAADIDHSTSAERRTRCCCCRWRFTYTTADRGGFRHARRLRPKGAHKKGAPTGHRMSESNATFWLV